MRVAYRSRYGWGDLQKSIEKKRGLAAPPLNLFHLILPSERELCYQRDGASVAGEDGFRVVEYRVTRSQIVQVAGAIRSGEEGRDVVDAEPLTRVAAGNVLRVIEDIGKLSAQT